MSLQCGLHSFIYFLNVPEFGQYGVSGFPSEDGVYSQRPPLKAICMLAALFASLVFSWVSLLLLNKGILPDRWDVFEVKSKGKPSQSVRRVRKMINTNLNQCSIQTAHFSSPVLFAVAVTDQFLCFIGEIISQAKLNQFASDLHHI